MITLREYFEIDPNKKDEEWATAIISHSRMYATPLVDLSRLTKNRQYLFSMQDMKKMKELFRDPDKSGVTFIPIAVMEKIRNVIIAEIENAGVEVGLKASDPTATNQRDRDRELLANRAFIEATMSYNNALIGLPPYKLADEKKLKGKDVFNGNVEKFDELGLDPSNDEDLNFFFSTHYRLRHEILCELPINHFMGSNEMEDLLALYVNDILAVKAVSQHVYVNNDSGAIEYSYVDPGNVKVIAGKRRDFRDATMMAYEQLVSVAEFMRMMGNDFDWQRDYMYLLQATNWNSTVRYSGIQYGGIVYGDPTGKICDYNAFLQFQVTIGYMEWKSVDAKAYRVTEKNWHGNPSVRRVPLDRKTSEQSIYRNKSLYEETTYKSYYLSLGTNQQKLYSFGKLPYQMIEGVYDQYSGFSIIAYREFGKSAVEVAKPHIDMLVQAFLKFQNLVVRAKPPGRAYILESLLRVAKAMFPEKGTKQSLENVIAMFEQSSNEIWPLPKTDEGDPVGGAGQASFPLEHGLSKSVIEFKGVVDWCFDMIHGQLGLRPMDEGDPREAYRSRDQAIVYAHKATQYIRRSIMKILGNTAKITLNYVQSIVRFRDRSTVPYRYLLQALGDQVMMDLDALGDIALHRYGIFVEALTTTFEKERMLAQADYAYAQKEISYEQYLLVVSIRKPKLAAMVLAYEKRRKERVDAEKAAVAQQGAIQMEQVRQAGIMQKTSMEVEGRIREKDVQGRWYYMGQKAAAEIQLQKQQMKQDGEIDRIDAKKEASIEEQQAYVDMSVENALNGAQNPLAS